MFRKTKVNQTMPNIFLLLVSALVSDVAWAEYDPEVIKRDIIEQKNSFAIERWEKTEKGKGDGWVAKTTIKGLFLSVGSKKSGLLFTSLKSSEEVEAAMAHCLMLGTIGMSPKTEAERSKISAVIQDASQSQMVRSLIINSVKFEVKPQEVVGMVFLSCMLSPDQQKK